MSSTKRVAALIIWLLYHGDNGGVGGVRGGGGVSKTRGALLYTHIIAKKAVTPGGVVHVHARDSVVFGMHFARPKELSLAAEITLQRSSKHSLCGVLTSSMGIP